MRVLVVEDDPGVARWIARVLAEEGLGVDVAATAAAGRQLGASGSYDLAILDLELPDGNGVSLVHELRGSGQPLPIVIMSGRGGDADVVAGLDAGADDYLVKPVATAVLRARVRAALRRGGARNAGQLVVGELTLDRATRIVRAGGRPLELRPREHALLEQLMLSPETVVRRTDLLERVWGFRFDPRTNVLDATMSRLRQQLARAVRRPRVRTVRGVGFVLTCEE